MSTLADTRLPIDLARVVVATMTGQPLARSIADQPEAGLTMSSLGFDHDDHDYYEPFAAP